jgi:hypothetical protein
VVVIDRAEFEREAGSGRSFVAAAIKEGQVIAES